MSDVEELDLDALLGTDLNPPTHKIENDTSEVKEEVVEISTTKAANNSYGNNNGYNNYKNNNSNYKPKENKINMYEVDIIKPLEIDTDLFEKKGKSFMVETHKVTDVAKVKIYTLAKTLIAKGYVFRHDGNADDEVQNKILELADTSFESYLPYKKGFNENIEKPILVNYYVMPFYHACHIYGKKYNDLKKGGRAIYASKVHAMLGKACNNPIDFLLCYNPTGDETYPKYDKNKKIDYDSLGNLGFYLKVADVVNFGVYNIHNDDSVRNLVELIK